MNSCLVSLQCAVSHGPEGSIFVKTIFTEKNSYKLSLQRNSRMVLTVIQHTERFCTLMAWQVKGFSPLCTLVQILRMSILLNDFVQKKAPERILPGVHSQMILADVRSRMLLKATQNTKLFCTLKAVVGILIRV